MAATRRRGMTLESAILQAGWEQLVDEGYSGFTFEAIADRARTGKAVLYRRWPDKQALLLALLSHQGYGAPIDPPDTGSLRGDVLALLRRANRNSEHSAALFSTVLSAYFSGEMTMTPAQLRDHFFGDHSTALTLVVERAVERGEIPAGEISPRVISLPSTLLRHELLMHLSRIPDETIVEVVDTVFMPLVTDPRRAG